MKKSAIVVLICITLGLLWHFSRRERLAEGLSGEGVDASLSAEAALSQQGKGALDPRMDSLKSGMNPATVKDFEQFLEAAGHSPEAWIVAYLGTASPPALLEELKKFPNDPSVCYIISTGVSTPFESLSWARKLVALQPENGFAKLVLADALDKQGRYEEAAALKKEALAATEFRGYGEGAAKCLAEHQDSLGETQKIRLVRWGLDSKFYSSAVLTALRKPKEAPKQNPRERLADLQGTLDKMVRGEGFAQFSSLEERQYIADVTVLRLAATALRKYNDPQLIAEWKPKLDAWGDDHPDPSSNSEWDRLEPSEVSKRLQESLARHKAP